MRFGEIGVQRQGFDDGFLGLGKHLVFGKPAVWHLVAVGIAEPGPGLGEVRVQFDRVQEKLNGLCRRVGRSCFPALPAAKIGFVGLQACRRQRIDALCLIR